MTDKLPSDDLEWTGERYLPRIGGGIELEHRHRYLVARQLATGKRVLDIASGEGYGSAMLADVASHVWGVDISEQAVAFARLKYRQPNLEFKVGSCAQIPLEDHSVDVVVSFETIEHHTQHHEMMGEIKRVLAPGGILIISSPDKLEYSDLTGYSNPFHVKELYREEFKSLLNQYFRSHFLMGQRVLYGSAIVSEGVSSDFLHAIAAQDQSRLDSGLQHAIYLLAVASDGPLPTGHSSLLEEDVMASDAARALEGQISDWSRHAKSLELHLTGTQASIEEAVRLRQAAEHSARTSQASLTELNSQLDVLRRTLDERQSRIDQLQQAVDQGHVHRDSLSRTVIELEHQIAAQQASLSDLNAQFQALEHQLAARAEDITRLNSDLERMTATKNAEISATREHLNAILNSRSWRLTAPYRKTLGALRQTTRQGDSGKPGRLARAISNRRYLFSPSAVAQIRRSPLFDERFYLDANPDVRVMGLDPARHYLLHGWRENRDPSASFSNSQYLADNPDVQYASINPLLHYIQHGQAEGRRIGLPVPPPPASIESAATLTPGEALIEPSIITPDSNVAADDRQESDFVDGLHAEIETIRQSKRFDESFYRSMYPDCRTLADPIRHYCEIGWKEGRNPSDDFDTDFYLDSYSDIRAAGINPFWHYIVAGASEQRAVLPESTAFFEQDIRFGEIGSDIRLLAFYSDSRQSAPSVAARSPSYLPLGFGQNAADATTVHPTLRDQADLARRHGLHGFCFSAAPKLAGNQVGSALQQFLADDSIRLGVCVQLTVGQLSDPPGTLLLDVASDVRCIRIDGRPAFLVQLADEPAPTVESLVGRFRQVLSDSGHGNPFLIGCWPMTGPGLPAEAVRALFDGALDCPANPVPGETGVFTPLHKNGADVVPYRIVAAQGIERAGHAQHVAQPVFSTVTLARDHTVQPTGNALVYSRFNLKDYRRWLDAAMEGTRTAHPVDRRYVFLNGWNGWHDGLFLEPDRRSGFGRLNETSRALLGMPCGTAQPKVSVIVPNYNHEAFLRRRLTSIYGQSYGNIEVILLDDRSSDQSRAILDQYAAAYPEITRSLYNETNSGGPFRQWAKGIKAATGDLVWIAESDDFCDDRFLETLVRCFEDESVLLAYSKCVFVDQNGLPMRDEFKIHVGDLSCADQWSGSYVATAHREVVNALGIKNTIPNASGVVFRRPVDLPLLDDESWLSMRVAGDWIFYLELIRGGRLAYSNETSNYFRRYEGSTAEATYRKEVFYREVGMASRTAAKLYDIPESTMLQCKSACRALYHHMVGRSDEEFERWYDYESIVEARNHRQPTVMVATMGFYPGGAEILPIRLANEFKRQGLSVLLLSAGLNPREDGVRRMLRRDIPVVETSSIADVKAIISDFGIEALNTHQWHIQKYPFHLPDVFSGLNCHVASLHGMIEHGDAFGVTEAQLRAADGSVTTWVYTADKNLGPFTDMGLYDPASPRFVKLPNGMQPPVVVPVSRAGMGIPDDAFVLCCVSRAIVDKGWDETIQVVERARIRTRRDIRLILVGNGPVHDEYCKTGVPDFVHLAGFSENAVGYYSAADMGIMLTKFKSESFPLTIVDCLFAGRPYIATDVGEIRNMLTESGRIAGDVVELNDWEIPVDTAADVVGAFATDPHRYAQALSRVTTLVNRYRIDVVAAQYVRLFQGLAVDERSTADLAGR